jgi:hypothetical protein
MTEPTPPQPPAPASAAPPPPVPGTGPLPPATPPVPRGPASPDALAAGRVLIFLVGGLLTLALLVGGSIQAAASMARTESFEPVSWSGIDTLDIKLSTGAVHIQADDGDTVHGFRNIVRQFQQPSLSETVQGGSLKIEPRCAVLPVGGDCSVSYDLTVPRGMKVMANSSAGRVEVTDLGGTLRLDSSAGKVVGERLRSPIVVARSSAGGVALDFATAPRSVRAESSAGSVDIVVPRDDTVYKVSADRSLGEPDVNVNSGPQSDHTIDASTSAGSVDIHYPDS